MTSAPLRPVRGQASAEEIAAILAALDAAMRVRGPADPSAYERWRQTRLKSLRTGCG